jgi:hypothetical protein
LLELIISTNLLLKFEFKNRIFSKMQPKREILSVMDMQKWKKSKVIIQVIVYQAFSSIMINILIKCFNEYINFIKNLNDSVKASDLNEDLPISEVHD